MKKMMILVSAIMMAATAANAQRVETTSFNEVRVNVPARVRIVAGDTYSVSIAAENEELASTVNAKVKDGVLCINTLDLEALTEEDKNVRITIVTPHELKVSTSRDMQATVLCDTFVPNKDLASK